MDLPTGRRSNEEEAGNRNDGDDENGGRGAKEEEWSGFVGWERSRMGSNGCVNARVSSSRERALAPVPNGGQLKK